MAWIEWHGKVLPTSDQLAKIKCSIQAPNSPARQQCWSLSLRHTVRTPEANKPKGFVLSLAIDIGNLGFQLTDWQHLGRQTIIATPDWHERTESIDPYGNFESTWLYVDLTQHDPDSNQYLQSEWMADYYRITLSPSADNLFPCEIDAWLMRSEDFHTGAPLSGEEIRLIPTGPPNLRILGLARFDSARLTFQSHNADPEAIARRRLAETIALHKPGTFSIKWWAETERRSKKRELPPPPSELRRVDVTFRLLQGDD